MNNQEEPEEYEEPKHRNEYSEDQASSQEENLPEERELLDVSSNQQEPSSSPALRKYFQAKGVSTDTGEASVMNTNFQRSSKDASTNTAHNVDFKKQRADGSFTERDINTKDGKCENCMKGVIWCHVCFLNAFPTLEKFLFCIPLRYGVYTIIASEEIYFFLRSYSRVLHLAMPSFFPDLTFWLATTELLLSLAVMFSGLLLLIGVFINPNYIFWWMDIHLVQIFIYLYLAIWLAIYGAVPLFHLPLVFSAYILAFLYSMVIVNSFRRNLDTEIACPSDLGPPPQEFV